ncbi:hypothetical protein GGR53DRAFT_466494 [Hypoxylon sp. FL1150]|nr:hypothetical protein GGR53DRAFT_466494 [Hypoxylon sp. FL1150]
MATPFELIAASKPFRILVGPDKKEFTIHTELLSRMSKPLDTLVNGGMKEAEEGVAEWPEVDEGTFVRFWEFAYTGDYRVVDPVSDASTPLKSTNNNVNTPENEYNDSQDYAEAPQDYAEAPQDYAEAPQEAEYKEDIWGMTRRVSSTPKDQMWQQFQNRFGTGQPAGQPNRDPLANYSKVLLSHACLYVFADYYCVDALMALCLRKLHRTLKVFDLHGGARVPDVAQLIDYSYKNTVDTAGGEPDGLRSMLATYAACKIEELWGNAYFQDILESGEVSKAIIGQLMKRLR